MSNAFRRQCRPVLGTYVEISLHEDDLASGDDGVRIFDAAYSQIETVQQQMSFHDRASDLNRINQTEPGNTLLVADEIYEVLAIAKQVFKATHGLFDCGVGKNLVKAGLLPAHGFRSESSAATSSLASVQLNERGSVTLLDELCLDLGGIAKGFAVDKAIEAIRHMGVDRCVVNAGGDLRVTGDLDEEIFVRHPAAPGLLVLLGTISNGSVATSAPYYSLQGEEGNAQCALFSPSGESLAASHSYSVLASECVIADALTKAVAVAFNRNESTRDTLTHPSGMPTPFRADFLDEFKAQAYVL